MSHVLAIFNLHTFHIPQRYEVECQRFNCYLASECNTRDTSVNCDKLHRFRLLRLGYLIHNSPHNYFVIQFENVLKSTVIYVLN